jgi:hypothetical protein
MTAAVRAAGEEPGHQFDASGGEVERDADLGAWRSGDPVRGGGVDDGTGKPSRM